MEDEDVLSFVLSCNIGPVFSTRKSEGLESAAREFESCLGKVSLRQYFSERKGQMSRRANVRLRRGNTH